MATTLPGTACGSTIDASEDGFGDSANYSGSDTGGGQDVGVGLLDPGECIADPKVGVYGYKYQCGGAFVAHVGFVYEGTPYELFIPAAQVNHFGDGHEPYAEAKVMACCGELDPNVPFYEQPSVYAENCLLDFRQQACISVGTGLAALINDGTVPDLYKPKAIEIQHYIASRTEDCIQGLLPDDHDDPELLMATWELPDDGPWAPYLTDVSLVIDSAVLSNLYAPEQPDTCEELGDNNSFVFTAEPNPLPNLYDILLEDAHGGLFGPGDITGSAAFSSLSTLCADHHCSSATFSTQDSTFAIDSMKLQVFGDLRVSSGEDVERISNARLELYSQARGRITGGGRTPLLYTINPGDAQFLVVGQSAGEVVTIPVLTSTPIVAHESGGEWSLDAFSLEFVDDTGVTWTLTVGASAWL